MTDRYYDIDCKCYSCQRVEWEPGIPLYHEVENAQPMFYLKEDDQIINHENQCFVCETFSWNNTNDAARWPEPFEGYELDRQLNALQRIGFV